jgi:hypothetical protein
LTANDQSQSLQQEPKVQITRQSVVVLGQLEPIGANWSQLLTESLVLVAQEVRVPIECLIEFSNSTAC